MSEAGTWEEFCTEAAAVLRDALSENTSLEAAVAFFESATALSNASLRQYIVRAICEIDGNRRYYLELIELFEAPVSESELLRVTQSV
jgi:hypothetical protein